MGKDEVEAAIAALEAAIWKLDTWVLVFALILFIGLTGETVLGVAHWLKDRQLRPLRALQAQFHEKDILDANTRALEAQLALEKFKAPRDISPEQEKIIRDKVSAFPGQPFTIRSYNDDPEAVALRDRVGGILVAARWSYQPTSHVMGFSLVIGVLIQFAPSKAAEFGPAARSLAETLSAQGIRATAEAAPGYESSATVIHISIGKKPS